MTKIKNEVIEISASEIVIPLKDTITQELIKHNLTEAILLELEKSAEGLEISGIEDKVNYEAVNKLRIAAKNTRVLTTKVCKQLREDSIAYQKEVIKVEKEVTQRIEIVEDSLASKQKIIDDQKDKIKIEKERIELARLSDRTARLTSYGMIYNQEDSSYSLEDIRMSVVSIKQYDDFTFSSLEAAVKTKFLQIQEIKKQEDEAKEIAAVEAKRIAEENLARQEELNKKEAELKTQQDAINAEQLRQKAAAEKLIIDQQEADKKTKDELLKARKSALFALGFSQQNQRLTFKDLFFLESEISKCTNEEWQEKLHITTENVNITKQKIEEERLLEIEKAKTDAIEKERKRVELENIAKEKLKQEENLENLRKAAMAPDLDKVKAFFNAVMILPLPDVSSEVFNKYVAELGQSRKNWLTNEFSKIPK